MAEYHSALYEALIAGSYGTPARTADRLTLAEERLGALLQIAGWEGFDDKLTELAEQLGLTLPPDYQTVAIAQGRRLYRTAPGRVLIQSEGPLPVPETPDLVTLDLSHSKTAIVLRGAHAADVLSRTAPMDFGLSQFPVGRFAQTGMHEVAVLIERTARDRFRILAPYTWARSVWDRLRTAAIPFGYDIPPGEAGAETTGKTAL